MSKLKDKQQINSLILLFTMTYMVSYMTRINFGAVITEIEAQTGMTKTMLSAAVTGSSICYGVGQILSGYIGDRLSPKRLVFSGLLVTTTMNLLMLFCGNHIQMTLVWCVNGLAQAFMWPPMVRLLVGLFDETDYKRATTMVTWGSSFGTIAIYLAAPAAILISGWRLLFVVTAFLGAAMSIIWNRFCIEPQLEIKTEKAKTIKVDLEQKIDIFPLDKKASLISVLPLIIAIMFAIIMQGALRDGVTTWMPSYISETYHLSSEISILTGVLLPIFSIVCTRIALMLYENVLKNPLKCAGVIFGAGALSALILACVSGNSALVSVLGAAMLTGSMYGVNLMLISMIPPFFQKYGKISTVSGILNSCTYIGSAISTYGIAILSEYFGWRMTAFVWCLIAVIGMVICFASTHTWKKKMM